MDDEELAAARQHLAPDRLVRVVVGPLGLRKELEKTREVTVLRRAQLERD